MRSPCGGCPFRKDIEPGALGGSGIHVYLGQAAAPFMLHCHRAPGYSQERSRRDPGLTQCAGAAIYRANTGIAEFLPAALLRLPAGDDAFGTPEEFLAHHSGASLATARAALEEVPVAELAARQRERASNTYHAIQPQHQH